MELSVQDKRKVKKEMQLLKRAWDIFQVEIGALKIEQDKVLEQIKQRIKEKQYG